MVGIRRIVAEELCQRGSSSLEHGGAQRGLGRIQIEPTVGVELMEGHPQEAVYFPGNFLMDRFGRFFS